METEKTRRAAASGSSADLGRLDKSAIDRVREEAQPDPRDADELHDALLTSAFLTPDDLAVDATATARLRAKLRAERGPVPLFDRGFASIEELKARCKDDTGLDAPQAPTFPEQVRQRPRASVASTPTKAKAKAKSASRARVA